MKTLLLSFAPDGTAHCLHSDAFPIAEIGSLNVRRASKVEFNDDTQQWEVHWPGSTAPDFAAPTRSACITWEIEQLNAVLANGGSVPSFNC